MIDTASDTSWLTPAAAAIANLGFTLDHRQPGLPDGGADLLVAFREVPTLRHFDPEYLTQWWFDGARGREVRLQRPVDPFSGRPYAWGRIRIVDRLAVENHFLSFGGTLNAGDPDATTTVVRFRSPAPIYRWAGHSQGLDPLVDEAGAFFGRLMVPIDFQPGAEARIGGADPLELYAAFVHDVRDRYANEVLRRAWPGVLEWAEEEAARLAARHADAWSAAPEILGLIGGRG